ELLNAGFELFSEARIGHLRSRDADDLGPSRQRPLVKQVVERRNQLAVRQVAGSAENDDDAGLRGGMGLRGHGRMVTISPDPRLASMDSRLRILDASANRAREALRTMEDVARFRLGERELCRRIKALRHDLREALDAIPGGAMLLAAHRDTPGDVGTGVKSS